MKESHRKGVANHPDPESCVASREAAIEALTGAHAGRVWSCEIIAIRVHVTEGNTAGGAIASTCGLCAVRDPWHAWKLHAREPGDPVGARRGGGPVGEGHEPEVQHARRLGVGRLRSTDEVSEQRRATASGGYGGKATDQGEHRAGDRAPDSEPDRRVERPAGCA